MKTLSIVLTIGLIFPILYSVYSAFSVSHISHLTGNSFLTYQLLVPVLTDLLFIVVACMLNSLGKYLENSIMCGTILIMFTINVILNFGISLLYQWSR